MVLGLSRMRHFELTGAVLGPKRPVGLHGQRVFGKGPQLHRAAHAMRGADPGDADRRGHARPPLIAYAVLAAASACALRSLRGTAFSGFLRGVRLATPAASRKRITRSDGCAPLASQDLTLSMSSLSRASLSFGSSGLKWPSRSMKRPSRGKRESATTT